MNHDIDRTQVGFASESEGFLPHMHGPRFNQSQNNNLVARLMDVNSEQELDYFLGDVISSATSAVGDFINSPTGQQLGSALKSVAKQVAPQVLTAVGNRLVPGIGGTVGGAVGTAISSALGDSEAEQMEWEAANSFVNIAGEAAKKAAAAPPGADPQAVARHAIIEAAKIHAPGWVGYLTGEGPHHHFCGCGYDHHHHHHHHAHEGRWYRHGQHIIVEGV
jgi:hypothetical protein